MAFRIFFGADIPDEHARELNKHSPMSHEVFACRAIGYEELGPEGVVVEAKRAGFAVIVTNDPAVQEMVERDGVPIKVIRYRGKDDLVRFKGELREHGRRNRVERDEVGTRLSRLLDRSPTPTREIEPMKRKFRP